MRVGMKNLGRAAVAGLLVCMAGCGVPLSNDRFEDDALFLEALPQLTQLEVVVPEDQTNGSSSSPSGSSAQLSVGAQPALSSPCASTSSSSSSGLSLTSSSSGLNLTDSSQTSSDCNPDAYRQQTYRTASHFNEMVLDMLAILDRIREEPPTNRTQDSRTWGPWKVQQYGELYAQLHIVWANPLFSYELRISNNPDRMVDVLMSGVYTPGSTAEEGEGRLYFDFTTRAAYVPEQERVGEFFATYSTLGANLNVEVSLLGLGDQSSTERVDEQYAFLSPGDGSGRFFFDVPLDSDEDGISDKRAELWSVWQASSRGRSDVFYYDLDLSLLGQGTECWTADQSVSYFQGPGCGSTGELSSCMEDVIGWTEP